MSELEDVPVWHNSRRKPGPTGASRELFGSDVLARQAAVPGGRCAKGCPSGRSLLRTVSSTRVHRGNACYAVGDYVGAAQLYSDALLQAAGDPAACCALLLNRSAAHAGLQQWQASLADANKVLGARAGHASCIPPTMLAPGRSGCASSRIKADSAFFGVDSLAGRPAAVTQGFSVRVAVMKALRPACRQHVAGYPCVAARVKADSRHPCFLQPNT